MGTPIEPESGIEIPETEVETPGVNPAWNDVLSILPEGYHNAVTEHFKRWDEAANQRIESVNAQLKDFEPYKAFAEHNISTDELQQGIRLLYEINNNPETVYNALIEAYKFGQSPEGQSSSETEGEEATPFDITQHPEYQKMQQNLQTVTEVVYNDIKAKQDAQADMELDKELSDLESKHGKFDVDYVITKMMTGMSGEQAVEAYKGLMQSMQPEPFAPSILSTTSGNGSGLPSNKIDVTKLNSSETKNLVAQMAKRLAGG
ncbi:hypothetical protein ACFY7C_36855 [Streptomyces sp. NPDC012769]|uniref:hypothetical protein n=1 Tax=Streptomyces sp. NPDC012769 TaxID=3364848 RepID=UPI0036A12905